MWTAILACGLLLARAAASSELQFLATWPALLKADCTEKLCVNLANIQEQTSLKVDLDHAGFTVSIFNETVPAGDFFRCSDFHIPKVEKAAIAFVTMKAGDKMERKSVVVNGVENICNIQTDKPIYKAGQEVKFRVICMNGTFNEVNLTLALVEVHDPYGNRLMQLRDMPLMHSFATFRFQLLDEPDLGYYQIYAETSTRKSVIGSFNCQQYVLPKFNTELKAPRSVTTMENTMNISVSGRYTFDKPLVAKVDISVCRKPIYWNSQDTCNLNADGICEVFKGELGPDGTMNVTVNLEKFQLSRKGLQQSLNIEAKIIENGTDIQEMKSAYVWLANQFASLSADYGRMEHYYKRGLDLHLPVILQGVNNELIANEVVQFYIQGQYVTNCTTDVNGTCAGSISTTDFVDPTVVIQARYRKYEECFNSYWGNPSYPTTDFHVTRFYSKSGSFLRLGQGLGQQSCGQTIAMNADYILNRAVLPEGTKEVSFNYMVISKSVISVNGQVNVALGNETKGSFSIPLTINYEFAPTATFVVFTMLPSGEVVADTTRFEVERCFQNQVSLAFSTDKALPGSTISLLLEAGSDSYCGIRAVDQSVILLNGGREESLGQDVYNLMPYSQLWGYYQEGFDLTEPAKSCVNQPNIIHGGLPYQALDISSDGSVADTLMNIGLLLLTGVDPRKPIVCPIPNYCPKPPTTPLPLLRSGGAGYSAKAFASESLERNFDMMVGGGVQESFRTNFPETWLFEDTSISPDGTANMSVKIPDTITEWKGDMFCFSESKGFGTTVKAASVIAFQEFFNEMTLPFSIIRKEQFVLKVVAFNYVPQCVKIKVTLLDSSDYTAESLNTKHTGCVCQNERTTSSWTFVAKTLGNIKVTASAETIQDSVCNAGSSAGLNYKDTVVRQLLVEPEGIKREETQSALICTKDGPASETIDLKLPGNVVEGSGRAFLTILGDPMGIAVQNLNNLVNMPSGCGEQNIAKFRGNFVAWKYMNSTRSLTTEKNEEIKRNLEIGYMQQLTFYSDGGFSTWSRSSWNQNLLSSIGLTAMTYGTLAEAQGLIFVDPKVLSQSEIWMASQQNLDTGAFNNDGHSYNNIARSNVSLTAHIVTAFLKAKHSVSHPVVREALRFLDTMVESSDDTYEQVMMCYAYSLLGHVDKRDLLLGKLAAKEVHDGNGVRLKSPESPTYPDIFYSFDRRASSSDIMNTAYYLLCSLQKVPLSAEDLTHIAGMGRWLGGQMNSNGGFSSTSDTAIALEAMSEFQQLTYVKGGTNTVDIKSGGTQVRHFNVDDNNRLVLQQQVLTNVPRVYTVNVTGTGCVYCQTTLRYNIELSNTGNAFNVIAWTSPETCVNGAQTNFDIHINVSYTMNQESSGMAIVDVRLPSGYDADISSLSKMMGQNNISRYETKPTGHVTIYFDHIFQNFNHLSFGVTQTTVVENLQPSIVRAYAYYKTEHSGYTSYTTPCSQPSGTGKEPKEKKLKDEKLKEKKPKGHYP